MQKLIIEVRMNEYTARNENPNVPWTPREIINDARECRDAGASIVHFHNRTTGGLPDHSFQGYREIVADLRESCDLLLHPTLGADENEGSPAQRLSYVTRLVEEGFPVDFAPMDMGSTNVDFFNRDTCEFKTVDKVYVNTTATLMEFAHTFRVIGMKPCLAIWNVGMLRLADAFVRMGLIDAPPFLAFSFGGDETLPLHPASSAGIAAFTSLLAPEIAAQWTAIVYGGSIMGIGEEVIRKGGHLSFGLGDHSYSEFGSPTNAEMVRKVVQMARDCGRDVATPEEARSILGMAARGSRLASA
jgi:uncharacterized protein (DUF849 family)